MQYNIVRYIVHTENMYRIAMELKITLFSLIFSRLEDESSELFSFKKKILEDKELVIRRRNPTSPCKSYYQLLYFRVFLQCHIVYKQYLDMIR